MPENKPQLLARLSQDQYKQLEKQVQPPMVGDRTTELQAGFQLGIQHTLKLLRDGFVIGA